MHSTYLLGPIRGTSPSHSLHFISPCISHPNIRKKIFRPLLSRSFPLDKRHVLVHTSSQDNLSSKDSKRKGVQSTVYYRFMAKTPLFSPKI